MKQLIRFPVLFALLAWCMPSVFAEYPDKPIRIYVPTISGGTGDIAMRLIADKAKQFLGESIIVENKSGGVVASIADPTMLSAPVDGYTEAYP